MTDSELRKSLVEIKESILHDVFTFVWIAGAVRLIYSWARAYGFELKYWPTVFGIVGVRWLVGAFRRKS